MTDATQLITDRADAIRYRWLRDQPKKQYSKSRSFRSPYVVDPQRSRLYAVVGYTDQNLDGAIDQDILEGMSQHIFEQMQVEGDERFRDPSFLFSDEFSDECQNKARIALNASNIHTDPAPINELTPKDAGYFYNMVRHALMDVTAPHGGCKSRLIDIAQELETLMENPKLVQLCSDHTHLSVSDWVDANPDYAEKVVAEKYDRKIAELAIKFEELSNMRINK